jgi:Ser-tRNA(Ala) deacylase AlaX
MTKTLYLEDSYMRECDAGVVEVIEARGMVLDQTVFYPRGGGQPGDTGKMTITSGPGANRELRVVNVLKKDGKIIHELEAGAQEAGIAVGSRVHLVLDWERRYCHMRMHTAAHVLAATMHREIGVLITGNEIGADKTRFDFNTENFDRALFDAIVKKANDSLSHDVELKIYTLPREEAMKIPGVVKLANALPPSITQLRIVEIPGIDTQADGGTHVKNLKEVGQIELLKLENKGKTNRRIYFALKP